MIFPAKYANCARRSINPATGNAYHSAAQIARFHLAHASTIIRKSTVRATTHGAAARIAHSASVSTVAFAIHRVPMVTFTANVQACEWGHFASAKRQQTSFARDMEHARLSKAASASLAGSERTVRLQTARNNAYEMAHIVRIHLSAPIARWTAFRMVEAVRFHFSVSKVESITLEIVFSALGVAARCMPHPVALLCWETTIETCK